METCEFETSDGKICGSHDEVESDPNTGKNLCKKHRGVVAGACGYPYGRSDLAQALRDFKILNR